MKLLKKSVLFVLMSASMIIFTSAVPAPASKIVDPKKVETVITEATADGKVSNKELANIVTAVKGEKLTLKEKIAIKLFGKKITSKFNNSTDSEGKSQVIALILAALVGGLGIHRFYLGYTWQGIVQLLTLGGCGIWALIDLIRIITGDLKPKDGEYAKTL